MGNVIHETKRTNPMGPAQRLQFETYLRSIGRHDLADREDTYVVPEVRKVAPFGYHRPSKHAKGRTK